MALLQSRFPLGLGRRTWPLFLLGAVLLLAAILPFDRALSAAGTSLPDPVRSVFFTITDLGLSGWILVPSLILFFITAALAFLVRSKATPRRALVQMAYVYAFIFIGVGLPGLVANLVKRAVGRARPELYETAGHLGFQHFINDWQYQSFVSGHAVTIFASAFVLGFLTPRWFWAGLAVAVLVAVSRVIVGAHYPSDVIGGAMVGTLGAYAVRNVFASRRWLFQTRPDGTIAVRPFSGVTRLVQQRGRTRR